MAIWKPLHMNISNMDTPTIIPLKSYESHYYPIINILNKKSYPFFAVHQGKCHGQALVDTSNTRLIVASYFALVLSYVWPCRRVNGWDVLGKSWCKILEDNGDFLR